MSCYRLVLYLVLGGWSFLPGCKKNEAGAGNPPASGSRLELSLDSLFLYARETYLWQEALPAYSTFAPRQYAATSPDMAALQSALQAITQLAINPATGQSYEYRPGYQQPLYSYIAKGNIITGRSASVGLDGAGNDMGLGLAIVNNTAVYIRYVEHYSPAYHAGLTRGLQLLQANGSPVVPKEPVLKNLLEAASLDLLLRQEDGTTMEVQLQRAQYTASPVYHAAILPAGNKRVGYLALARFSEPANAQGPLQEAFDRFAGKGITHLVIDLRYNTGGYVETASYLANLIASPVLNGSVMYTEHYNSLLQQGKAPILRQIPYLDAQRRPVYVNGRPATYADVDYSVKANTYKFEKKGPLTGIKSVVFLVSGQTASSAELLINCLQPYLDVKLVGSTTFGKPVGFFGIGIDGYTVYLAQFLIRNGVGAGDYFAGLPPDFPAPDDVTRDFGHPEEACLQQALQYISHSPYCSRAIPLHTIQPIHTESQPFTGMIERRGRLLNCP